MILRVDAKNETINGNLKILNDYNYSTSCGRFNSPQTPLPQGGKTNKNSVYWLCGSIDILMILSLIVTIFLMDDIKEEANETEINSAKKISKTIR